MSEQPTCLNCGEYDHACKCPPKEKKILTDVSSDKGITEEDILKALGVEEAHPKSEMDAEDKKIFKPLLDIMERHNANI